MKQPFWNVFINLLVGVKYNSTFNLRNHKQKTAELYQIPAVLCYLIILFYGQYLTNHPKIIMFEPWTSNFLHFHILLILAQQTICENLS